MAAIERGWDELLRLAATIRSGRVSATLTLQRFGWAAQGDPLHRASEHLGLLLRTALLCEYVAIEHYRRVIHTLLNSGESVRGLQRSTRLVLRQVGARVRPAARRDEGDLRLASTADEHRAGLEHRQDARPTHLSHINFRGAMKFGAEKFAAALIPQAPSLMTQTAS